MTLPRRPRVAVVTLGCPKNLVDSEVMAGLVGRRGLDVTSDLGDADGIVINTCAFIGPAREEAWSNLAQASRLRREGPCRALVVAGCLPQGAPDEVRERFPEVDRLLGTGQVEEVAEVMAGLLLGPNAVGGRAPAPQERKEAVAQPFPAFPAPGYLPRGPSIRLVSTPRHYAYLKVGEGCDHRCAFCVIPRLRGPYRSRPIPDLVAEAQALESLGAREVILVAQDTTAYGRDLGTGLTALVRALVKDTGLGWIRVLYGYPGSLPADFVDLMAAEAISSGGAPRVCRYLDLPMQHASDRVLKAMRRPETRSSLLETIAGLRARVPGIVLRSSFILGFPGETDRDVRILLDFLREVRLDHAGFFAYSREERTPAAGLPDQIPEAIKEERLKEAAALQRSIAATKRQAQVGRKIRMMVDKVFPLRAGGALVIGRTEGDAPEIDGRVLVRWTGRGSAGPANPGASQQPPSPGALVEVAITRAGPYDLRGRPVPPTTGSSNSGQV